MSTITLPNIRVGSDLIMRVRLKDNGVAIDWSTLSGIKAHLYSDVQRALAGRCDVAVDGEDPTLLVCRYAATKMQYLGENRIIVQAQYSGSTKTYDKPVVNFVRWTADTEGEEITIDDPDVSVEIEVEDVSSSVLDEAIYAALAAADDANEAATRANTAAGVSEADHLVAVEDHGIAEGDHTRAGEDHTRAVSDHGTAADDHSLAVSDHGTASDDHTLAASDHVTAGDDHTQAASDHGIASSDHTRAGEDHTAAANDHTRAGEDHTRAGADHTQAGNDHTRAGEDHTTAAADHTQAGEDHTQALADHEIVGGYNTRLTAVEGEVDQLELKVGDLGEYIADDRFVRVVTDSDNKILYGVTPDGDFYFGAGCPSQVKAYVLSIKGMIDSDILAEQVRAMAAEATKVDKVTGKSLIDSAFAESQSVRGASGWLEVKTDSEDKIIEGINENGEKFIGKFDEHTEEMIRGLITIPEQIPSVIRIPSLDANFVSPIPVQITGTKGEPSAKYEFTLPETNAFNIRVKFKLKEDILGANNTLDIASIGGASVTATPIPLTQCITDSDNDTAIDLPYSGTPFENKWPAYMGGVAFNSQSIDPIFGKMNIGRQAFSIRYVGNGSVATVENNGTALVFNIDGVTKSFSFATYPTINELFEALNDDADFDVVAIALDYHNSSELAIFSSVQLISTLHGNTDQTYHPAITEYTDNGPFYLHYAINEDWHQVEIVKMGDKIYSVCDGNTVIYDEPTDDSVLALGGECDVLFEDLEIHLDSIADFEYEAVTLSGGVQFSVPISEVNPYIVIFEAHDINTYPTYQQPDYGPAGYNQNIDGLDWCFAWCKNRGYIPVSIKDIEDYYIYGKPLPRKCYTIIMDGWHWDTVLNLNKRSVFLKYGVKPCLAIEERQDVMTDIYHNGQQITIDEAVKIAKVNGFDVTNHTINHTSTYAVKPSDRVSFVTNLVYNFEADGIDGETYTFPGGCTDPYMNEVFEYLGIKAGIEISRGGSNNITRNRFTLGRLDIGTVYTGTGTKINYNPGKLIKVV